MALNNILVLNIIIVALFLLVIVNGIRFFCLYLNLKLARLSVSYTSLSDKKKKKVIRIIGYFA